MIEEEIQHRFDVYKEEGIRGRMRVISTSKIKKIKPMIKNWFEKERWEIKNLLNPHS